MSMLDKIKEETEDELCILWDNLGNSASWKELSFLVNMIKQENKLDVSQEMVEDQLAHQCGLLDRVLTPSHPIIKPRDIPQPDLDQLQGLEATSLLQMFFALIEQRSDEDDTQVQVAKGRVSSELVILIHNNQREDAEHG